MEEILISIVDNMQKRIIFVDEKHNIRYLNYAAKEHFIKKGYDNLIGKSLLDFHKEETNQKIKRAISMLLNNPSLPKVMVGDTDIFAVRINDKFCGYYEQF